MVSFVDHVQRTRFYMDNQKKFLMNMKPANCPECMHPFLFKDFVKKKKQPLLIGCGHSVCEGCIRAAVAAKRDIVCKFCSFVKKTEPEMADDLHSFFPIDQFTLGRLMKASSIDCENSVVFRKNVKKIPTVSAKQKCSECCSKFEEVKCKQCDVPFCESCFDMVHGAARSLKSHEKLALPASVGVAVSSFRTTIEITSCAEHKDQKQDFYCKSCSQQLCSRCAVIEHGQHEVVLLSDQNKLRQKSLDEALEKATRIHKRLLFTRKKAQASLHCSDRTSTSDHSQLQNEISMHFQHLHGLLQIRESHLLDEVKSLENEQVSSLNGVIEELTNSLKDAEMALKEARLAMKPDNFRLIDANNILNSLQEVCTKPCFLLLTDDAYNAEGGTSESIQFKVDDKLGEILKDYGSISSPPRKKYVLKSEEDLPADFKADPVPAEIELEPSSLDEDVGPNVSEPFSLRAGGGGLGSVASSGAGGRGGAEGVVRMWSASISDVSNGSTSSSVRVLDVTSSGRRGGGGGRPPGSDESTTSERQPQRQRPTPLMPIMMPKTGMCRDLSPGTIEEVKISHINNPSCFYVQRKRANYYLEQISRMISKTLQFRSTPKELKEGWVYLVEYSVDKKWYRARVTKFINENQILVHFIDFGNEDICSLKSFRLSTDKIKELQPLANECKIYNCHPNPGPEWSSEANKMMAAMCKNSSSIRMHVINNREHSPLEVDLKCYMNGTSSLVRDTLVFHSFATFDSAQKHLQLRSLLDQTQYNPKKHVHKAGSELVGVVMHVEDPFNFYINSEMVFYEKLMFDLNNYYNHPSQAEPKAFFPSIDMAVAVHDQASNCWYRAKITRHPGNQTVELFYVDTGKTATVNWKSLRGLENRFLRYSYLAVKCELYTVAPNTLDGWTEEAKAAFLSMVQLQLVRAHVAEKSVSGALAVVIYKSSPQGEMCVNGMLIEQGLAASTSIISPFVTHKKALLPTPKNKKKPFEQEITQAGFKSARSRKYRPQEAQISPVTSIAAAKSESHIRLKAEEEEEEGGEEELDEQQKLDAKRFPCTIIKIVDPSHFYIMFDTDLWERMKKDITEFYSKEDNRREYERDGDWKEDDVCVFQNKDKVWYRAIVASILPDNKVKLLVKDIVEEVTVDTGELYNLKDEFKVQDISVRCHLCDLRAPGGQGVWPSIAIEEFQEHVADRKVYFMQKGEVDGERRSLPAELWLRSKVNEPGPLEPVVNEWYTVNKYLADKGLALPDAPPDSSDRFKNPLLKALMVSKKSSKVNKKDNKEEKQEKENDNSVSESSSSTLSTVGVASLVASAKKKRDSSKSKEQYVNPGITDWLPAEPLHDLKLTTAPTYVDYDCNVYIQDSTSADTLRIIETSLQSKYRDSRPSAHDSFWSVGQLCIVQYHADLKWYRGRVLEVQPNNTYKVVMVDYGNQELCKATDMRKNLLMTQIPVQCHVCAMTRVRPVSEDGKWGVKVLDYIHSTIVDRVCQVELTGTPGNYSIVNIEVLPGLTLTNLLMNMQYAVEVSTSDEQDSSVLSSNGSSSSDESEDLVVEKETVIAGRSASSDEPSNTDNEPSNTDNEQSNQLKILESIASSKRDSPKPTLSTRVPPNTILARRGSPKPSTSSKTSWVDIMEEEEAAMPQTYKTIELPPEIEKLEKIESSSILSATTIFAIISETEEIKIRKYEFVEMQNEMQAIAKDLPLIKNPKEKQPCCSKFASDGNWYRGEIMQVNGDICKVKFVDYGNFDLVQVKDIHEIKPEWLEIPVQGLQMTLYNLRIAPEASVQDCGLALDCLFEKMLTAVIKNRNPLLVELFTEDGESINEHLLSKSCFVEKE